MTGADEERDAVRRHLERFWPDKPQEEFAWMAGPIEERPPGLRVRRVAPVKPTDPWVYITVGAFAAFDDDRVEFFMVSPSKSPRHVETLTMVASMHADQRYRLSVGHTVDIGRPWIEGAIADHLLVSLPYPYGPNLEHCEAVGRHVKILWLLPITHAEARLVREQGLEPFEQLLDNSGADVISPVRPPLA